MARPIFVVGAPRSGTTWLANIICRHSEVACVRGTSPGLEEGINESAFFSNIDGVFGDLKDNNNLIQLIEIFSSSNFFLASGLDKKIFYNKKPDSYPSFFRLIMEHVAEKEGKEIWLDKTPAHSFFLERIVDCYGDAKVVAIKRTPLNQIKSLYRLNLLKIKHYSKAGHSQDDVDLLKKKYLSTRNIYKMLFKYHAFYKHIHRMRSKEPDRVMLIEYEHLLSSKKKIILKLCKFLEIEFEDEMLVEKDDLKIFSSFKSDDERGLVFTPLVEKDLQRAGYFFDTVPYSLFRMVYLIKHAVDIRRKKLPPQFFINIITRHNMDAGAFFADKD